MRTIDKIITRCDTSFGAPMGRSNVGSFPLNGFVYGTNENATFKHRTCVYDRLVPMSADGAYDRGAAYWGLGAPLRVRYTKDLSYVEFYRSYEKL